LRETLTITDPPALGRTAADWIDALTGHAPARGAGDPPLLSLLALLAAGRFDLVRAWLRHLHDPSDVPLVVARYAAWSGDLAAAAGIWQQVRATALQFAASTDEQADEDRCLHVAATLAAVARTATDLGDPHLAAALHGPARRARERLPSDLSTRARLFATACGLVENTGVDDMDVPPAEGAAAAWGVLGRVHGLIGAEPDATRHRLRLRPRISAGFTSLHVRDIGFGDGTIRLAAELAGDVLTVRVGQDSGAIPATVLLEPVVAYPVAAATVDGVSASLQPRTVPGGVLVPVQLVLDADRELRLELDARRPPG
jgi:hypothetical protein